MFSFWCEMRWASFRFVGLEVVIASDLVASLDCGPLK